MQAAVDAMSLWRQAATGNESTAAVGEVMPVHDNESEEIDICLSDSD